MDTTNTHTNNIARQPRDHTSNRRAYLDTYAKKRVGATEEQLVPVEPVVPVEVAVPVVSLPKHITAPVSIAPPVAVTKVYQPAVEQFVIETQAPVVGDTMFSYQSSRANEAVQSSEPTQKSYLDTLTQRHTTAVAAAPQAEETVIQPSLNVETESLFDDPAPMDDNRMEANLAAIYGDYSLTSQLAKNTKSASASHVRTIVASSLACGILALGIFGVIGNYSSQPVVAQPIDSPVIEVDASNVKPPAATTGTTNAADFPQTDPSHPVRMLISSIGVNAPVQSLGTTTGGLIDVPQSYGVVGWYNKGAVPGKPGPAILVGHYTGGNGGVFDKLKDLNENDLITVTNGKGQAFTYKVSVKTEYEKDAVPMAELFKTSSDSKLHIITCSGKWQSKNYNKRLVVTAEIVK